MNIKQLIKEAHDNAVQRGFYPKGEVRNIGELLMLIVSELGEALEAHRNNKFADWKAYEMLIDIHNKKAWNRDDFKIENAQYYFESKIKDTFEDEIADVFIRLFDLCGYLDYGGSEKSPIYYNWSTQKEWTDNIGDNLRKICKIILDVEPNYIGPSYFSACLSYLNFFCNHHNIPIEKHIKAKMAYNRTRPHKHGKEY
jgi:NTP pyrophosphatase (non-canonical NTP hydrolase)